ncbi:MAG TPA: flagellar motor protein MotD [Spongiibacteraceae bacterium]|nr:flagellar motor protein MotD [Spongiibacteraceae bacterium]
MGRRKHSEEHTNHERWLVSYADFITLLFAFFVVMYSISQVNESKYRVLSNTLEDAFNQPELSLKPIQVGETAKSNPTSLIKLNADAIKEKVGQGGGEREGDLPDDFQQIANKIEQAFGDLMKQNLVSLRGNEEWLEVEMSSSLLFDSGDATLSDKALELLGKVSAILKDRNNAVRVEGFTDDVPIHNSRYPSNWELSSARAAAVVELFVEEGVDASRLVAAGYGEFQPVVPNDSPEHRTKNRRVVLMISKTGALRPQLKPINVSANNAPPVEIQGAAHTDIPAPVPTGSPSSEQAPSSQSAPATAPADANTGKTP